MKQKTIKIIFLILAVLAAGWPRPASACSTFVMGNGKGTLFGRSYDFFTGTGFIMTNPRGLAKTALVGPGNEPAEWVAKYGSVTFNQVGREFPMDGMNEAGLVVACMWLSESQYPAPDSRKSIMELQWMQYLLDTCASIEDVTDTDQKIRIAPSNNTVHFLVCDRNGDAAAVEFLNGETKIYRGKSLPFRTLTNSTYSQALSYCRDYKGLGGNKAVSDSPNSVDRFTRLAVKIKKLKTPATLKQAFYLLDDVKNPAKGSPTQWQSVYDPNRLTITFKTRNDNQISMIRFRDVSFDCQATPRVLDLDVERARVIGKSFSDYTAELNHKFVKRTFAVYHENDFVKDIPEMVQNILANYPTTLRCQ